MEINKVFGIGLSRTGTHSLNTALEILGFKSIHYPKPDSVLELMDVYDAGTDITITVIYKKLDKLFPNSKFILTTRELDDWLKSVEWYFSKERVKKKADGTELLTEEQMKLRETLYGNKFYDEEKYRREFIKHDNDVRKYFKNRPNDLLIMNVFNGDGFDKLCPFLRKPVLDRKFPHFNYVRKGYLINWMRKIRERIGVVVFGYRQLE
jgi:hypothetical protein